MKIRRSIAVLMMALLCTLQVRAQDIVVTVNPVQEVLPPQVLLYLTDPGKYFNITLTNTTASQQQVYLGLQLEQTNPSSGLAISTPPNRQPQRPFVVPANSSYQLTTLEMKKLFDHIPASEVNCPANLFTDYSNGSFGLLPEGIYQVHVTAYRWRETVITQPEVVSNPMGGTALFRVCYKAQAPDFILPTLLGTADPNVAEIDPFNAMFTWNVPVVTCGSNFASYTYDLRIVELLNGQQPDYAISHNPIVYQKKDLLAPMCLIQTNEITAKFTANQKYVAQLTAKPKSTNQLDYVMIENQGKSSLRIFRIKTDDEPEPTPQPEPTPTPEPEEEEEEEESEPNVEDKIEVLWGNESIKDSINADSLYTFRNPTITAPIFLDYTARKVFTEEALITTWRSVFHVGGEGLQADTLRFSYEVQLFTNGGSANKEEALSGKPIYTKVYTENEEFKDSIPWDFLKDKVQSGDYLVLRVKPTCVNGRSVAFTNDSVNVIDFAMIERLTKQYFECSNQIEIENTEPTTASASDLKGKVVAIGEYDLTIDEIEEGDGENTWKGKGRVEWNPLGTTIMVCVKFSDLKINTDNQVFEGTAQTYAAPGMTSAECVDQLFSDWGIDNLIGDAGVPYADAITSAASDKAKDLAKKIDLSKYYSYVKKGQQVWNLLGKANIDELYFPIALPKEINSSPVDLQIAGMKFAATHATMDVIGQFTLPKSNYLKNDILVLGAPRLCISPDNFVPEGGTVALLSDFGIKDPETSFEFDFKAPTDLVNPTNGCYIAWKDYKFEIFGLDVEMKIPGLKKDVNGVATNEMPKLKFTASISDWDDLMVDQITMDPFQAEDLPGWTFTAQSIVYDQSVYRNAAAMGSFPKNYDTSKVLSEGNKNTWQGLYIKKIAVKMPKALEFGTSGDKRLEISADNMFFDKSGATLDIGANDILSAKTGKAGGWAFSLDRLSASFIQNDFTHCGFSGKFDVPLIDGEIGYSCQILKVNNDKNSKAGNYAYIFKVQQMKGLSLDFFLATTTFNQDLTYFLVEAVPEKTALKTRVELLMSGDLTIGGNQMKSKMKNLAFDFNLPGIHFSKMRLANCKPWESQFDDIKELQGKKDEKKILLKLYEGKEITLVKDKCYFHTGQWSLASLEKDLGPFKLSLDDFKFDYKNEIVSLGIEGTIKLLEGVDLSASAGLTIKAKLSGLQGAMSGNFSKLDLAYKETTFDKAAFNTSFAGITIKGSLTAVKNDKEKGNGYSGTLDFTMPGDLFKASARGGYYERPDFSWGFFYAKVGGAAGIPIPPIQIDGISAGFYFNCVRKNTDDATPKKGVIGVVAGMGISSSAGKSVFGGDFEMTVIYDKDYTNPKTKKKGRLSTFMLTGDMKALNGMINSKATVVYQEDDMDKFFALNITVDGKVDSGMGVQVDSWSKSLTSKQKELNSKFQSAVTNVKGGLEAINDNSTSKSKPSKKPGNIPSKPKVGEFKAFLDLRVTMKENGKKLSPVKWHLYLGEPEETKRCQFILIDFKSPIVSVNIGTNVYLCVGNELPNNGQLPPIPEEISNFLDGSVKGEGVVSDDVSKAEKGRKQALADFKAQVNGGVMMGASAWGYVDIDLGLFYGSMGALAGFDVALLNFGDTECMNIKGTKPGYKGWYAQGQLYAYLYSEFGVKIDLGFWEGKLPIIDAGIGGVFQLGLPNPTYFTGKARIKCRLLGGLVDINRKFEFECGQACQLYYGDALDDFKLFGDFALGSEDKKEGWNKKNAINPKFYDQPVLNTEAPIREHFRVLDETELNRLAADFNGDKDQLKSQASRTFIFDMNTTVKLYEYNSSNQSGYNKLYTYAFKGNNRFAHVVNMADLKPNKYYKLMVTGWAKEISEGKEIDPLKWNDKKKKYESVAWKQTKYYYFCTGPSESLEDCPEDLQKYVMLAYPSYYNELTSDKYVTAYTYDIGSPKIAFNMDISKTCYKKGKLKWRLDEARNGYWTRVEEKDAYWVTTDSTCNLSIAHGSFDYKPTKGKQYRLKLDYDISKTVTEKQTVTYPNGRQGYKYVTKVVTETVPVGKLLLMACDGFYHTGKNNNGISADYEKPFVGIRLNSVTLKTGYPSYSGKELSWYKKHMAPNGANPLRYINPYTYIAYMSNYGLVGGWELTNTKLKLNATTAQSLIYCDRGGVYEGVYNTLDGTGLSSQYTKIKALSIYDRSQWKNDCLYPLPELVDGKYTYFRGGKERAYKFKPASSDVQRASELIKDLYEVYRLVDLFDSKFRLKLQSVFSGTNGAEFKYYDYVQQKCEQAAGTYITVQSSRNPSLRLETPYYQTGILWGSHFDNNSKQKQATMWGSFNGISSKSYSRPDEEISENIVVGLIGNSPIELVGVRNFITGKDNKGKYTYSNKGKYIDFVPQYDNISKINVTYFRVNSYNFKKAEYTVVNRAYLNHGSVNSYCTCTISNPHTVINYKNVDSYYFNH